MSSLKLTKKTKLLGVGLEPARDCSQGILSREESDASVKLASNHIEKCGWGYWAASLIQTGEFIGFIGLEDVYFSAPFNEFTPAVEIGWRPAVPTKKFLEDN